VAGRIEDYAIVGDMQSVALIGIDGSVDWLCLPRFDSEACFAAMLGDQDHGHWRIAPADARAGSSRTTASRRYAGDTLFERLLTLRNDVGLLSEEYDPRYGRLVGNMPQAFSHVPLVQTALNLGGHAEEHRRQPRIAWDERRSVPG
jgi:GH15 family glucan-1,4-alpha-glucosidase